MDNGHIFGIECMNLKVSKSNHIKTVNSEMDEVNKS